MDAVLTAEAQRRSCKWHRIDRRQGMGPFPLCQHRHRQYFLSMLGSTSTLPPHSRSSTLSAKLRKSNDDCLDRCGSRASSWCSRWNELAPDSGVTRAVEVARLRHKFVRLPRILPWKLASNNFIRKRLVGKVKKGFRYTRARVFFKIRAK